MQPNADAHLQFIWWMAHELRDPLNGVVGLAEALKLYGDEFPPEERDRLLDSLLESGQRLKDTLEELLVLAIPSAHPARTQEVGLDLVFASARDKAELRAQRPDGIRGIEELPDERIHAEAETLIEALASILTDCLFRGTEPVDVVVPARAHAGTSLRLEIHHRPQAGREPPAAKPGRERRKHGGLVESACQRMLHRSRVDRHAETRADREVIALEFETI